MQDSGHIFDQRSEHELLSSFVLSGMKFLIGLWIVSILGASNVPAQTRADMMYRALLPISWKISFHNYLDSDWTWEGTQDTSDVTDSAILTGDTLSLNYPYHIRCVIDTTLHQLLLNYAQVMCCDFNIGPISYTVVNSHFQTSAFCTQAFFQPTPPGSGCICDGGWVYIGGAAPPSVVAPNVESWVEFGIVKSATNALVFKFNRSLGDIRILDLLGRERAAINLAPGATSAELNTAGFAPGMYVAVLGSEAVKFVVR